jgi:hypothetical protein
VITLSRRPLTDAVLAQLQTTGKPIGDGVLPDSAWIGQPNAPGAEFDPFAVLSSLNASDSFGGLSQTQANWKMPYLVESFGVSRAQCEWMADAVRAALGALRGQHLDLGASYKVAYVRVDAYGEPARIDVTDPEFFHSQDQITIWVGKATT